MSFSRTKHEIFFCENTQKVLTNVKAKKKRFLCEKPSKIEGINHKRDVGTPNGALPHESQTNFREKNLLCNFFCLFSHTRVDLR